jgi:hypothetical protein
MKSAYKISVLLSLFIVLMVGCTKDFETINKDPNKASEVPTYAFLTNAQKQLNDNMFDEWWGGRQSMLWSQYWAQNNYTDEDRYNIRQNINNSYWRMLYTIMSDLNEIIRLNTDEATKAGMSAYGSNANQIASARILRAWTFQHLTDLYGDIPYFDALKANQGSDFYLPKYDKQADIYPAIIMELTEAAAQIDGGSGWTQGDVIYGGDMSKWKKFANSIKLRMALRMMKADLAKATQYANEAIAGGVFESNADNAVFKYLGAAPNTAPMYTAYYINSRTDFAVTGQFVDLLKGIPVGGAQKANPFAGIADPRLPIFADPVQDGTILGEGIQGMPYGMEDGVTKLIGAQGSSWPGAAILAPDFACIMMNYSEVAFILSELNGWNQAKYIEGVTASLEYWGVAQGDIDAYVAALPAANMETVLTQKYIAFYTQGYEAWSEYRRTGYPKTLVHPNEVTWVNSGGEEIKFIPLQGEAIPRRLTYPQEEQTVNVSNYQAAVSQFGQDDFATRMWWDKP